MSFKPAVGASENNPAHPRARVTRIDPNAFELLVLKNINRSHALGLQRQRKLADFTSTEKQSVPPYSLAVRAPGYSNGSGKRAGPRV